MERIAVWRRFDAADAASPGCNPHGKVTPSPGASVCRVGRNRLSSRVRRRPVARRRVRRPACDSAACACTCVSAFPAWAFSFAVGPIPRSLLRLGWCSRERERVDEEPLAHARSYQNRKAWCRHDGWLGQMPRGLPRGCLLSSRTYARVPPARILRHNSPPRSNSRQTRGRSS